MTLIEAFSCGLPAIGADQASLAELIDEGSTGFHFTPGSALALRSAVSHAIAQPEQLQAMGKRARLLYERNLTPQASLTQLIAIYGMTPNSDRIGA